MSAISTTKARPRGRTRQLTVEIAERLVAEEGVDGLKLKDIADEIGIQVPSLYKHFNSREEILNALSELYIESLSELFVIDDNKTPEDNLTAGIEELTKLFAQHPAWMRLQLRDYSSPEGIEALSRYTGGVEKLTYEGQLHGFVTRLEKILQDGVSSCVFRKVDADAFGNILFGSLCFQISRHGGQILDAQKTQKLQSVMADLMSRYVAA